MPNSPSSSANPASARAACSPSLPVASTMRFDRASRGVRVAACPSARTSPSGRSPRSSEAPPASWRATAWRASRPASRRCSRRVPSATEPGRVCAPRSASRPRRPRASRTSPSGAVPRGACASAVPPCSSSRTSTGPTTPCWPSSTTSHASLATCPSCSCSPPRAPRSSSSSGPGAGFVAAAERLPLGPLSGDETAQLILAAPRRHLPARQPPGGAARSAAAATLCSPRNSCACFRTVACSRPAPGRRRLRDGVELPTPESIGALIAARLDLLRPEPKALLADAAVVGTHVLGGGRRSRRSCVSRAEVFEGPARTDREGVGPPGA